MLKKRKQGGKRFIGFGILGFCLLLTTQLIKYYFINTHYETNANNIEIFNNIGAGLKIKLNKNIMGKKIKIENIKIITTLQSLIILVVTFCIGGRRKKGISIILILVGVGGVGNLINRLGYGPYVIDYFFIKTSDIIIYFNLEDLIVIGAGLVLFFVIIIYGIKLIRKKKKINI